MCFELFPGDVPFLESWENGYVVAQGREGQRAETARRRRGAFGEGVFRAGDLAEGLIRPLSGNGRLDLTWIENSAGGHDDLPLAKRLGEDVESGGKRRPFCSGLEFEIVERQGVQVGRLLAIDGANGAEVGGEQFLQQRQQRGADARGGELDLVDVDVSPGSGFFIDDHDVGLLAGKLADIPRFRHELFVVATGGCAHEFAVDEQANLGGGMCSATDKKADVVAFDGEGLAGELARRIVAADEGIDHGIAGESADGLLIGKGSLGGFAAEGVAFDFPLAVAVLEVLEDGVGAFGGFVASASGVHRQ